MAHRQIGSTDRKAPKGYLAHLTKAGQAVAKKMKWNKKAGPKKIALGGDKIKKDNHRFIYYIKGAKIMSANKKNARPAKKGKKGKRGRR